MAAQLFNRIGQLGVGIALAGGVVNSALFNVDGGHRAVIFDRFAGIKQSVVGEGTHFMIPWVQRPILFDIRSRPKNVPTVTGSKDLQNVNITLRILFRFRTRRQFARAKVFKFLEYLDRSPTNFRTFTPPLVRTTTTECCPPSPTRCSRLWWPSSTPANSLHRESSSPQE